jgi:hypothetical protein
MPSDYISQFSQLARLGVSLYFSDPKIALAKYRIGYVCLSFVLRDEYEVKCTSFLMEMTHEVISHPPTRGESENSPTRLTLMP